MMDGWLSSGANYFTPLVSPEGLLGSEVQPRRRAEDCIWLNCAVVFYTIMLGSWIRREAHRVNRESV